jgi:hypothetical protein
VRFQYTIRKNDPVTEQRDRELEDYLASLLPTAWTAVTFQNSWVNVAGQQPAQYRRIGDMVHLRGYINTGANSSTAFTLPAGFRPPRNIDIPASSWTGTAHVGGNIYVQTSGSVAPTRVSGSGSISYSCQFSISP